MPVRVMKFVGGGKLRGVGTWMVVGVAVGSLAPFWYTGRKFAGRVCVVAFYHGFHYHHAILCDVLRVQNPVLEAVQGFV